MGKPLSERTTMLFIHTTTVDHLLNTAWDLKQVESDCMQCKNYDVHFSCPHHEFNIPDYLHQYQYALIVSHAIPIDQARPMTLDDTFYFHKKHLDWVLVHHESDMPGSMAIIPGPCQNCQPTCETSHFTVCPNPDLLRYSYESLGFDVSTILKVYFDKELTFSNDQVQFVYGYLLQSPLSQQQLADLKGQLNGEQTNDQ